MEQRISLVTLGVSDMVRARSFYADGLGWTPSALSNEHITFFQCGGVVFGLYGRAALAADAALASDAGDGFRAVSLAYNARTREEVDDVLALAVRAGAELRKAAEDVFWGGYSGYFADPDGHLWEVAWNPGFAIDPDGNVTLPE